MFYQYAQEETARKVLGKDLQYFDPKPDYTYTPVSSNVEQEHGKQKKLQIYEQMLGRLGAFAQNPKIYVLVNWIIARMAELQGDEFITIKNKLLDEKPPPQEAGKGNGVAKDMSPPATSNQSGIEQSGAEQVVRGQFEGMR